MGDIHDSRHICGAAKGMNGNYRPRARRDRSLYASGIEIETPRFDIHEDWESTFVSNRIRRRNKSERWNDDFVARPNSQCPDAQMQSSSPGAYRNSKTLTDMAANQFLKFLHLRSEA
jgi:hypothetical protein